MDPGDIDLRNVTYQLFVDLGRAPTVDEVVESSGSNRELVESAWRRLHEHHALVLDRDGKSLRMANPFSAVPTPYRVLVGGRWWFANCAWDAFGICAALRSDGRIETACADCGEAISVEVRDELPSDDSLVFHCLVPASAWWEDIAFT
jgi:hypothetical protein